MPAQATGAKRAMPWVVASARWAVPKASFHVDVAQGGHLLGELFVVFFSPLLQRQFSSSTTSPAGDFEATIDPVLDQAHRLCQQLAQAHGDRREGVVGLTCLRSDDPGGR